MQALLLALITIVVGLIACEQKNSQPTISFEPSRSSPLALSSDGNTLWIVNPDADTVTELNTQTLELKSVTSVAEEPWAVAVTPKDLVVVMNRSSGSLSLLEKGKRSDLWVGSEPAGLALSPTGRFAFVSISSSGELVIVDLETRTIKERLSLGQFPWSVAVTNDGDTVDSDETIIVSHKIARLKPNGKEAKNDSKEGWLSFIKASDYSVRERSLPVYAFGFANVLEGLAVQGSDVWVSHLLNSPELPRDFETTVSAGLAKVSFELYSNSKALHLNADSFSTPINFPRAVSVTRDKQRAYLVLAGTDAVMGVDLSGNNPKLLGFWLLVRTLEGIILSPDETKAYIMNYLSRDVSILDLGNESIRAELARVRVSDETP